MSPREKGIKEFLRKKYFHAYGKLRLKTVRLPPRTKSSGTDSSSPSLRCLSDKFKPYWGLSARPTIGSRAV